MELWIYLAAKHAWSTSSAQHDCMSRYILCTFSTWAAHILVYESLSVLVPLVRLDTRYRVVWRNSFALWRARRATPTTIEPRRRVRPVCWWCACPVCSCTVRARVACPACSCTCPVCLRACWSYCTNVCPVCCVAVLCVSCDMCTLILWYWIDLHARYVRVHVYGIRPVCSCAYLWYWTDVHVRYLRVYSVLCMLCYMCTDDLKGSFAEIVRDICFVFAFALNVIAFFTSLRCEPCEVADCQCQCKKLSIFFLPLYTRCDSPACHRRLYFSVAELPWVQGRVAA